MLRDAVHMQSQYGSNSGSSGGHVGVTQAQTFAGENGNSMPTNDIHLDASKSNFVIGPDGKVPSLASQVRMVLLLVIMTAVPSVEQQLTSAPQANA